MRTLKSDLRRAEALMAAYHEAGHAVAAVLGLIYPNSVAIFKEGVTAGETATFVPTFPTSNVKPKGPQLFLLHGRLRMLLAGHASEKRFFEKMVGEKVPRALRRSSGDDFKEYRAAVRKAYPGTQTGIRARLRKKLDLEADAIVEAQWPAISTLARALAKHRELDYLEIKTAILSSKHQVRFWKKMFGHLEDLILTTRNRR